MKKLKYIKLFENQSNDIEIISIMGTDITLINPDGKKVTVEFDEDGENEDIIDDYVKEVSMTGYDDKYRYSTWAYSSMDELEIPEDADVDFQLISEYEEEQEKRRIKNQEEREKWQKENDEREARERREIQSRFRKSGMSKEDFILTDKLNSYLTNDYYINLNRDIKSTGYSIGVVRHDYYDEGKIEYAELTLYKIPTDEDPSILKDDDISSILGIIENPIFDKDQVEKETKEKIIGKSRSSHYWGAISSLLVSDPKGYIERLPYYAPIDDFISEDQFKRLTKNLEKF